MDEQKQSPELWVSDEEQARVISFLKGRLTICPVCGANHWNVDRIRGAIPASSDKTKSVNIGTVFRFVVISCNVCGNTIFLNEKVLKQTLSEPQPSEDRADG